jgi:phosphate uptake regulator
MQVVCCDYCSYSGAIAFNNLVERQELIDEHHRKVWREYFLSARKNKEEHIRQCVNTSTASKKLP